MNLDVLSFDNILYEDLNCSFTHLSGSVNIERPDGDARISVLLVETVNKMFTGNFAN
jgi:hypothetical protein